LRHIIRLILLVVLVWRAAVYWDLLLRDWDGWAKLGKKGQKRKKRRRRRRGYKKTKPFEGLTRQPACALCNGGEKGIAEAPGEPPPMIVHTRGAKRRVDTTNQYCPNEGLCEYYGWLGRGNITANGHPNGGPWRQMRCEVCGKYFQETTGTVFYRSQVEAKEIYRAIGSLCEGQGIRKVGRVFEVDKDEVLGWLMAASAHSEAVSRYMLHDLHLSRVQMDELYALLSAMKKAAEEEEENERQAGKKKRRHCWLWSGIDAESKLMLGVAVGDRSLAMAQRLVHKIVAVLAPGVVPMFESDQLAAYEKALLGHFGEWAEPQETAEGKKQRKPRWMPKANLLYAQVVKRRVRRRIVEVTQRVVYGTWKRVQEKLEQVGQKVNTAFIERVNRTWRARVPGLGRREEGLAKTEEGLERRAVLVWGYYNFCLPHASLREELAQPIPTKGTGSPKKWTQRTPAMAAGLTNHRWTVRELLLFRVPPWRQGLAA
jgi:transposase-like protein/IS1 family transposase